MQNLKSCAGCDMGAFDLPGGDILEATEISVQVTNWPIKIKTKTNFQGLDHCMALCIAGVNKDCVAWTFHPATKLCWLKNVLAEKQVSCHLSKYQGGGP